jgi:hypothetical protein
MLQYLRSAIKQSKAFNKGIAEILHSREYLESLIIRMLQNNLTVWILLMVNQFLLFTCEINDPKAQNPTTAYFRLISHRQG